MNTSDPLGGMGHQKSAEGDRLSLGGHHHHHHHQSAVSQMLYGAAGLSTGRSGELPIQSLDDQYLAFIQIKHGS